MSPVWEANHVWLIFVLVVALDGVPGRLRVDHVDALRAAAARRRRGSSSAAPRSRCAARRRRSNEARVARRHVRRSRRCSCRSASAPRSAAIASGARAGRQRRAATPWASWLNPTRCLDRRARGRDRRLPRRGVPGRRRRARPASATSRGRSAPRALVAGRAGRRARDRRAARAARRTRAPLFDGLTVGRRAGLRARLGACSARSRSRSCGRDRFALARLSVGGRRRLRSSVGWAVAQSPYLLPGELTLDEAAAGDATLTALLISVARRARDPRAVAVPALPLVLRGDLYEP